MDNFSAPFPIVQQPSIPMDPLKAALLREQALLKIKQEPTGIKGDKLDPPLSPGASGDIAGIVGTAPSAPSENGPRVGIMPPLPSQDVSEPPGGVTAEPANATEDTGKGPTDLTHLGDTSATPVAAAADPLLKDLTGETPTKGTGSFWNNPAASDSLIAFGAAMLRAPNFNTGLANGAEAVTKALDPYKMPTQAEIARATMSARLKRYAEGDARGTHKGWSASQIFLGPHNEVVTGAMDGNTGNYVYRDSTGKVLPGLPANFVPRQDSGAGKAADMSVKNLEEAVGVAADVPGTLADIDALQHDFASAGGGAGAINQGKMWLNNIVGRDVFGNLGSQQTFELVKRRIELAMGQTQRGLGQLTEGERQIIRDALPSLNNDPRAFWRITQMLKAKAERSRDLVDAYQTLSPQEQSKYRLGIKEFSAHYKTKEYEAQLKGIRNEELPDWLTNGGTTTTAPAAAPGTAAAPKGLSPNAQKYF
jgi:hypothetical protein